MKVSPHTHPESPLTGSTLANLIARAKEMGRTHFAYTDHGHLSSAMKAYRMCAGDKKAKQEHLKKSLQLIPGIEIYFKDATCPIVSTSGANRCKYFTATLYCKDQAAYQELCRVVSREDMPKIDINGETQSLWSWAELERLSKFNVEFVIGGPHCMVGKAMLAGHAKEAEQVLVKLNQTFGRERVSLALVCEPWTKKYSQVVQITYTDGSVDSLLASDSVATDRARRIKALDLIERSGHSLIKTKVTGGMNYEVNKNIKSVKLHKGFLPLPGGDALLKINRFLKALGGKHQNALIASDYAYYANKEDKVVQTMRLEGNNKLQPNFHMKTADEIMLYLLELFGQNTAQVDEVLGNTDAWADRFNGFKLDYEWRLADSGGNPIQQVMEIIKSNGRMRWQDPKYVARLKEELEVISKNPKKELSAYFLPIRDVLNHYRDNGQLTGPGRGSAGGALLCYLLGITQIDPFDFDLPFNRFFSLDRIMGMELPDIDVDLEDRELLVGPDGRSGYLYGRWGNKAAQVSTRATIRLKSAIKDANRFFKGKVEESIEVLTKGLPTPPQNTNDLDWVLGELDEDGERSGGLLEQSEELKKYTQTHPEEWEMVSKAMGLTRAYSSHASAFVLSDIAIQDTLPTKEGHITQYEAKDVEAAKLIKYDFLVVKQLKDIRVCMDLLNAKQGHGKPADNDVIGWHHPESDSAACADCDNVDKILQDSDGFVEAICRYYPTAAIVCDKCNKPLREAKKGKVVGDFDHVGQNTYVWKLPQLPEVFRSIWTGATETCFQINTRSMTPFVIEMLPENMMDIATLLALVRPGPMDFINPETGRNMVEEYMLLRKGEIQPDIKALADLLPETFGVIVFQEQLNKIARDLAGFSGPEAEKVRKHMAKKNMPELKKIEPAFMEGALKKVDETTARTIWERMVTFGRYGFSVIHAVEYAHITYACMFLKHFYPLEWWAAILTNATEQEITGKFWPYVRDLVAAPDINLSTEQMVVDYANHKIRAKFGVIRGLGEKTIDPIVEGRPYKDIQEFVDKKVAGEALVNKLIHVGVLDSLFPPKCPLADKLLLFAQAMENKSFRDKKTKAEAAGKKMRATEPRQATLPEGYVDLHPMVDAAMKKAVLPSMPISTYHLGALYSRVKVDRGIVPQVLSSRGHATRLINGEDLQRLDEVAGESISKDIYVASTVYIVKAEEFAYSKNTKRALKMIVDVDGYVSEKVLWPDYQTQQLIYPPELKKGAIATIFFKKRVGKKDMAITGIVVESSTDQPAQAVFEHIAY